MSNVTLSLGQQSAFDQIMAWHKTGERVFTLAGYAGTGKTTLARMIADAIDPVGTVFCAFTGKAANVLRDKGCTNTGTLHSYLYSIRDHNRKEIRDLEDAIAEARKAMKYDLMERLTVTLEAKRAAFRKPKFELNTESDLANAKLVIVDEYSMLNQKLIGDLQKIASKILYLGDPFQLPPVEGECTIQPSAFLTEIHRQALESPIIRAANDVREGRVLEFCDLPGFRYQPKSKIATEEYRMAEQIIVGKNITRNTWNRRFRELRGIEIKDDRRESKLPQAGEKMICLKNNPINDLFNGMIDYANTDARNLTGEKYTLDFGDKTALPVWAGDIMGDGHKYDGYREEHKILDRFDFAYAITCHKAQGSEFDSVLVYSEPFGNGTDRRRWLYTALTRAQNKCTLVEPGK